MSSHYIIPLEQRIHVERAERELRNMQTKQDAQKRAEVIAAGGSCLTCKHTKIAFGKKLNCLKKDKLVSQYNYCPSWITKYPAETSGESKS